MKRTILAAALAAVVTIGTVPTVAAAQARQERSSVQHNSHAQPTRAQPTRAQPSRPTQVNTNRVSQRDVQRAPNWRSHRAGSRFTAQQGRRWHLPAPGRAQTYVRRGNDLVLVNNRSYNIIRTYRGFFR